MLRKPLVYISASLVSSQWEEIYFCLAHWVYLKWSHMHWVLGNKMLTILIFPYSIWQGKIIEFLWEKVGFIVNLCFWVMIKERLLWLSYLIVFRENNDASVSLMDSCFSQSWQYRILGILLQVLFSKKSFPVNDSSLLEWYIKINQASMGEHVCLYVCMKEQFWIKKKKANYWQTLSPLKWNFRPFAWKTVKNNSTDSLEKHLEAKVFCVPWRGPCPAVLWCSKPKGSWIQEPPQSL